MQGHSQLQLDAFKLIHPGKLKTPTAELCRHKQPI